MDLLRQVGLALEFSGGIHGVNHEDHWCDMLSWFSQMSGHDMGALPMALHIIVEHLDHP